MAKKHGKTFIEPVSGLVLQVYVDTDQGEDDWFFVQVNGKRFEGSDVRHIKGEAIAYACTVIPEDWSPLLRLEVALNGAHEHGNIIALDRMWYNTTPRDNLSILLSNWDEKDPTRRDRYKYVVELQPNYEFYPMDAAPMFFELPWANASNAESYTLYLPYTEGLWSELNTLLETWDGFVDSVLRMLFNKPQGAREDVKALTRTLLQLGKQL